MSAAYLSVKELMAEAQSRTGLSDFGGGAFADGLEVLRRSLIEDVQFALADGAKAQALLLRRLENRLRVEEWFRQNPDAENAVIDRPISICGLPRTGTTALGNMLSLDPRLRSLRQWEQGHPTPPPVLETEMDDPRRIAHIAWIDEVLRNDPEQAVMHIWDPDVSAEDTEVLGLQFRAQQMTMPVWSYHDWWRRSDMRETFRYHARICRLLQSSRPPNRWLFKAPHHKFHLDHLLAGYPDIRFVFTHRDPAKAVPSYASFVRSLFPADVAERMGRHKIGAEIHNHLLTGMKQAVAARDKLGPERFLDIHHKDFVTDYMGVLERVYAFMEIDLTPEMRSAFQAWHAKNREGAHGAHRYTAEEFGLDVKSIRRDYAFYIDRFNVACG